MQGVKIDLEPLRHAIREHKMMALWGDSLFEITEEERKANVRAKALEAKEIYLRLMLKPFSERGMSNFDYQDWAVKTALGLRTSSGFTAQAVGGKHWKAWGS